MQIQTKFLRYIVARALEQGKAHIRQAIDVVEQEAIPEDDRKKI